MRERFPNNEFGLGLLYAFAIAIAIGVIVSNGRFAGIREEKEAYGSYQEQKKNPYVGSGSHGFPVSLIRRR